MKEFYLQGVDDMDEMKDLGKYEPGAIEEKWYNFWEEHGVFHDEPEEGKEPYSIVLPPPNVTGQLHMGHALDNTLQDILIRYKGCRGIMSSGFRERTMPVSPRRSRWKTDRRRRPHKVRSGT